MTFLLSQIWPWLLIILLIGVATALLGRAETQRDRIAPWLVWCALAFGLGVVLAGVHALQGRPALWLETALLGFATYFIGAVGGSLTRKEGLSDHDRWALGLIPAALVWFSTNLISAPTIETDLAKAVHEKVDTAAAPPPKLAVEGRDVLLAADAPERDALAAAIDKVDGVRVVVTTNRFAAEAGGKARPGETLDEAAKAAAQKAADETKGAAEKVADETKAVAEKVAEEAKAVAQKPAEEQKPARLDPKERAKTAAADLKDIPLSGELDAATCQKALSATLVLDRIQFRSGSATIHRASAIVLDRLAALLKRCPGTKVEIGGHTDNIGDDEDNQALSQRRADAVLKYLAGEGVAASRLAAVGYGAKKPIASNDDEDGRAENRRIEMLLK